MIESKLSPVKFAKLVTLIPRLPIISVSTSSLSFLEKPAFLGNSDQYHLQFAKSVAYGIVNPILTDSKGLVIDGERRVKAAMASDETAYVPCRALNEPLKTEEALFFRVLLNPAKKANEWAKDIIGGNPFAWTEANDYVSHSSIFMIRERAVETIKGRARSDLLLQQMAAKHDATLLETAKHCVNALRCLQSIQLNSLGGLSESLQKTKTLLETAITEITSLS